MLTIFNKLKKITKQKPEILVEKEITGPYFDPQTSLLTLVKAPLQYKTVSKKYWVRV